MSQIFEDLAVEKEVRIRKRAARVFNKRPEDFSSLRAYNDYLEMVEDITFNLMNEVDVAETEAKIAAYEQENKDSIAANQARSVNEQRVRSYQDELDKQEREQKHKEYLQQLEDERRQKELEKSDIIAELANSNKSAQSVIQSRQATALKRSSALKQSNTTTKSSMPSWISSVMDSDHAAKEAESLFDPYELAYEYTSGYIVRESYQDPTVDYLNNNKQARAGGYTARFAHQRALMSAFTGVLCSPLQD
ncbi:CDK-activating kinase assembly factor MAT1-domain-containing protein [Choanephora cucurbitarum]|nr:CDK-activating kinase assembly factor MAT1-domain-containing protein [Choanephora cucurbitarum]